MMEIEGEIELGLNETEPEYVQKVVILDTDRELMHSLEYLLGSYGFQTIRCEIGTLTPVIGAFDYVLADCDMAGIDAIDFTSQLRIQFPGTIIICMSRYDCGVECLEAGASDFLRKPFVPFRLAMMISGEDILI